MIELVFLACLAAAPEDCEDRTLQFVDMSMMACVMSAQPLLAQWVNEHPGWVVRRWTCQAPRQVSQA